MYRLIEYPYRAAEWAWKWWHGHCRPFCRDLDRDADGPLAPGEVADGIRCRCRTCGRRILV